MKLIISIICLIALMISGCSLYDFDGNYNFLNNTTEYVTKHLENKYDCNMIATSIGNRYHTGSTTLYFYSEDNPQVVFTAVVDKDTQEVKDDYISRLVAYQLQQEVEEQLLVYGIDCANYILLYGSQSDYETNVNITIDEYISKYSVSSFFVYLAFDNDSISASLFMNALRDISRKYSNTVAVSAFVIDNDFYKCKEDMSTEADISDTWFYDYDVINNFKCSFVNGECNVSESKIETYLHN